MVAWHVQLDGNAPQSIHLACVILGVRLLRGGEAAMSGVFRGVSSLSDGSNCTVWEGGGGGGRGLDTNVGSSLGFVAHIAICMLRIVSSSSHSATASVAGGARLVGVSIPYRGGWSGGVGCGVLLFPLFLSLVLRSGLCQCPIDGFWPAGDLEYWNFLVHRKSVKPTEWVPL
jgi:hypothetical protein